MITLKENRLNFFRGMLFIGLVFFPLWTLTHDFHWDSLRLLLGLICGWLLVISFRIRWIQKYIEVLLYYLLYIAAAIITYKFRGQLDDPVWYIYHVVIFIGLALVFRRIRFLVVFVLIYGIGTAISIFSAAEPVISPKKFIVLFVVSGFVVVTQAIVIRYLFRRIDSFAFATAHKLRAPIARLKGLSNIEQHISQKQFRKLILQEIDEADEVLKITQKQLD